MQPDSIVMREYPFGTIRFAGMGRKIVFYMKTVVRWASLVMKRVSALMKRASTVCGASAGKRLMIFGTAALCAGTVYGIAANGYMYRKTRDVLFCDVDAVPVSDVAIVLGARVYKNGTPSLVLQDRLWAAKRLYDAGKVTKIIVSGDHQAEEYNEPKSMYQFLVTHGVPKERIFMDHAGLRTLDTMIRAAKIFGVKKAVICTQRFHLGRSVYLARAQGIDAVGLESDLRTYRHHSVNLVREFAARSWALFDVHVFKTGPRHLGDPISLEDHTDSNPFRSK